MHTGNCGNFLRSGEDGQSFHKQGVDDALLIVQRDGDHDPRLKRPLERPTPTRPCWHSVSKARLKREICQPPKASCAHQAITATVMSADTITFLNVVAEVLYA